MVYKVFDKHAEHYDSWYRRHPIVFECESKVVTALNLKGRGLSVGVGTGILDSKTWVQIITEPNANIQRIKKEIHRIVETTIWKT